ncbi:MAG: urea transporter [Bacteroidales bacterium]|nr:urea transporter [Bacteroidales bacterium]MBN2698337.1 urea transporter [Bacteroidales bacterium]
MMRLNTVSPGSIIKGLLNSYAQIFFSDHILFGMILLLITFFDLVAGFSGLIAVTTAHLISYLMGFDKNRIRRGVYGFNCLLVGLGIGIQFEPGFLLFFVVVFAAVFTIFLTIAMQGVIGKYTLPYLSLPFLFSFWLMLIATNELTALGISERAIYTFNDLYTLGGHRLVHVYEWWHSMAIPESLRVYFLSLGAIFFQFNVLAGLIVGIGLLIASRISFTLSLLGFYTAYLFYHWVGADITGLTYSYIGFNYILTSIAIGGFFIIPSWKSYLWVVILMPVVALVTIAFSNIFAVFSLPIYSLPFNIVVIIFLYTLKLRIDPDPGLAEVYIQENTPEKNLYSFINSRSRFGLLSGNSIILPFFGKWNVSQGHRGEYTHKEAWKEAWDFIITDEKGSQFKDRGDYPENYYCYGKSVLAPSDGWVESVTGNVPDNIIGEVNVHQNWGNSVVIKHTDYLYSAVSHLQPGSITVKPGTMVKKGDVIGKCGNSGRSPYPHLHFQIQQSPLVGAPTLKYPLSYYIKYGKDTLKLCTFEIPEKGDLLSNIEQNEILKNGLNFLAYKTLNFKVNDKRIKWEVQIDPFNNTYLECQESGARAYFTFDDYMLYFKFFKGSRESLLYYFFLAFYKIQTGFYQGIEVKDLITPNYIFSKSRLFLQDIFAPFFLFLSAEYRMQYISRDNELDPSKITLQSEITVKSFGRSFSGPKFEIILNTDGIEEFKIIDRDIITEAVCIRESTS